MDGRELFITPRVPQGLAAAVESLTRAVIQQHPKDIYIFAAQHFENLLRQREFCQYDRHDGCKVTAKNHYNGHERPHNGIAKMMKKYNECRVEKSSIMKPLKRRTMSSVTNADLTICPKIITDVEAYNNTKTKNSNMNKIREDVINKFGKVDSHDDSKQMTYVSKVEDMIENTVGPIVNEKCEILGKKYNAKKYNIEARLDKTRNLLENISSCFSLNNAEFHRPHSADSILNNKRSVTNNLHVMLSETHDLLADISASFFNESLFDDAHATQNLEKNICTTSSTLPVVNSTTISSSTRKTTSLSSSKITQNINGTSDAEHIFQTVALPPVAIDYTTAAGPMLSPSDKPGQDFTLPLLANPSENNLNGNNIKLENNGNASDANQQYIPINELIEENSSCDSRPNDVISSDINPMKEDCINEDLLTDAFGGKLMTTIDAEVGPLQNVMETLVQDLSSISSMMNRVVKLHHHDVDLHSIDEEENPTDELCEKEEGNNNNNDDTIAVADEFKEDVIRSMNSKDTSMRRSDNRQDQSEQSSSVKETSLTDAFILESTTCIDNSETGNDLSAATEVCESSNEVKETTLTDGISLSLDDPMRPFIPELNLDSLQDVTVSSFKMIEDELCEDNTNSIIESPTSSNQYYQCDGEISNLGTEANGTSENMDVVREDEIIKIGHVESGSNTCEVNTSDGNISLSESRCVTQRVNSDDLLCTKGNDTLAVESSDENIEAANYDVDVPEKNLYDIDSVAAAIKIQARVRGFLARRRFQSRISSNSNASQSTIGVAMESNQQLHQKQETMLWNPAVKSVTIGNDFRGCHVGKRLCRENAIIERTVTMSIDDGDIVPINSLGMTGYNTLQHTGELHDCIVLPFHNLNVSANNDEYQMNGTKEIGEQTILQNDVGDDCPQIFMIGGTVIKNEDIKHIFASNELDNEMKWFPSSPVFHFDWNRIISDVTMDHIHLLSDKGMKLVPQDYNKELMSLPSSSSKQGVIIQEIIDTPPEELEEQQSTDDAHDELIDVQQQEQHEEQHQKQRSPPPSPPSS